jgi:hypothetical protein
METSSAVWKIVGRFHHMTVDKFPFDAIPATETALSEYKRYSLNPMSRLSFVTSAHLSHTAHVWLAHLISLHYMLFPCPTHPHIIMERLTYDLPILPVIIYLSLINFHNKSMFYIKKVKCDHELCGTRTWEWLGWRGPSNNCKQGTLFSSERTLHKDCNHI